MRLKVIKRTNKTSLRDKLKLQQIFKDNSHKHTPAFTQPPYTAPVQTIAVATARTIEVLEAAGLYQYFVICKKSVEDSKRIVQRCAQFIVWSYTQHHNVTIDADTDSVTKWFQQLMHEHYNLLLTFCEYLVNNKQLQPSTVRTYASDLERCFQWCTLFAPPPLRVPMNANEGIRAVAEMVRTNQARSQRAARSRNTWHDQVRNRRIPQGGLAALQAAVLEELPWARGVRQQDIDDVAYRRFMQLVVSAVYVFSANGRQSGVADVRMGQVEELLENGFTTTTKFKTNKKYGYQPITLGGVARELVLLYVTVVRPQVCRASSILPEDHLWLTYRGEADLLVGKLVTFFFIRTRGLSVTITSIRGLVETTMHQRYKAGQINETEKAAVQNINGHSSETTRDFYLYEDRVEDVHHARVAFDAAGEGLGFTEDVLAALVHEGVAADVASDVQPAEQSWPLAMESPLPPAVRSHTSPLPLPLPLPTPPPSLPSAPLSPSLLPARSAAAVPAASSNRSHWAQASTIDWGSAHPDYGTTAATARWTWAEKSYLGQWCARFQADFPEANNVVAKALKAIQLDSRAIAIFHAHHTLNSARLRHGLRQYQLEQEQNTQQELLLQYSTDVLSQGNY